MAAYMCSSSKREVVSYLEEAVSVYNLSCKYVCAVYINQLSCILHCVDAYYRTTSERKNQLIIVLKNRASLNGHNFTSVCPITLIF